MNWGSNEAIAVYMALGVFVAAGVVWVVLKRTARSRIAIARQITDDPDIKEWLVVFNWSNKILYLPTIAASLAAALVMFLRGHVGFLGGLQPEWIGGVWFAIFLLNFVVEEYELSVKVLLIGLLCAGLFLLWLNLLGWIRPFFRLFKNVLVELNATAYVLLALLGLVTIGVSWLRGLFYYVALTPNYMNIQEGPTETGEHIGQEDYNSRVDTTDFLERLLGFGRIVIVFKDQKRAPLSLLTWRIKKKTASLEAIRGTISIEQHLAAGPRPPDSA